MKSSRRSRRRSEEDSDISSREVAARGKETIPQFLFCFLCMIGILGPAAPWGLLHGLLFGGAGILMVAFPPRFQRPAGWLVLGGLWIVLSGAAFLPSAVLGNLPWRTQLAAAGVQLSGQVSALPMETACTLASMAMAGLGALWIIGQTGNPTGKMKLACAWVLTVVVFAAADFLLRGLGEMPKRLSDFGFFPGRNHTACLLVMGSVTALGIFVQSLRQRIAGTSVSLETSIFSALSLTFLVTCLFTRSISRAGIVLLVAAVFLWYFLLGKKYLGGHSRKATTLLVIAGVLMFFAQETIVKERLFSTLGKAGQTATVELGSGNAENALNDVDGRVGIHRDAWRMIGDAPWTGHGAGTFRFIFPQYQKFSATIDDRLAYHPESSWLWIAAENGIPAMLVLVVLALWIFTQAARDLRHKKIRALRAGCCAAAAVPLLHGFVDVSAHMVGILWSAALMTSLALPGEWKPAGGVQRNVWRLLGCVCLAWGLILLKGYIQQDPVFPSEKAVQIVKKSLETYRYDIKKQSATTPESLILPEARSYLDPLEIAMEDLDSAIKINPLDPGSYGLKGMLALHFDDKDAIALQCFAAQRDLGPVRLKLPLTQAGAWAKINVDETKSLWREAMHRATEVEKFLPETQWRSATFRQILEKSGSAPALRAAAIEIGGNDIGLSGQQQQYH